MTDMMKYNQGRFMKSVNYIALNTETLLVYLLPYYEHEIIIESKKK